MERDNEEISSGADGGAQPVEVYRISGSAMSQDPEPDKVVVERAVTVMVEEVGSFTLMCTPSDVEALAVGFIYTEGMIESMEDVIAVSAGEDNEDVVGVRISDPVSATGGRNLIVASSCGMCGVRTIQELLTSIPPCERTLRMPIDRLLSVTEGLRSRQQVFRATGGAHAAGIFSPGGEFVAVAEDIGRHNALDKAIGRCLLGGKPMKGCGVALSGRASFEMVAKAARAGIELISAVSAPSSLAIETAERWRITLCGFVRPGRANVYTCPERIDVARASCP